jgi:hypothetical protein
MDIDTVEEFEDLGNNAGHNPTLACWTNKIITETS